MGFVFVEANVKKWGLAPSQGTLSPPPAYGTERDTVLLAMGSSNNNDHHSNNSMLIDMDGLSHLHSHHQPPPYTSQHQPQQQRSNLLD
jgi:hypothetical protein